MNGCRYTKPKDATAAAAMGSVAPARRSAAAIQSSIIPESASGVGGTYVTVLTPRPITLPSQFCSVRNEAAAKHGVDTMAF